MASAADPLVDTLRTLATTTDDPDICAAHGQDWTRRFAGPVRAVVRPKSTAEVAGVLAACNAAAAPVVPQGGNTGLVGGSVPGPHDSPVVIISTVGLADLGVVDELGRSVTAGAGVTIADLHAHAESAGLVYGVDLASRESATVGGTVATNAGGIRVCAYGMTRAQVMGVECVLADGTVASRLVGLPKDNTGYDIAALMTGSEGTLGIITAVRLRLHAPPPDTMVMLAGVDDLAAAMALVRRSVPSGAVLMGAEVVDDASLTLNCEHGGLPRPLAKAWPYLVLIEASELDPPDDVDAVAGEDAADKRRLWRYREDSSESASSQGVVHKLDISVPLANLDALADGVRALMPAQAHVSIFGHLVDGNLHVEIAGLDPDDESIDEGVLELTTRLGGAVSAEHGVGRAKAAWLGLSRSPADVAVMRRIKAALDPIGVLNPGAVLPPPPAR
ncbi:MAG: FAD-binding oxidoreductase [Actinomycetota bacterium]|nr:FAD-binding oxidoreductase [Actinomycetota bacterium]